MDSPEIIEAKRRGWKDGAADLIGAGSYPGYESPDGRWFLFADQLAHLIRTGCAPADVPDHRVQVGE
jgi:hypothetical protein